MGTINSAPGSFSDKLIRCAAGTYVVNPLNGREMRREYERQNRKRLKKALAPKQGF